jgi:prepilin-type N-terminal cleavage/methylation domain-containing protein
MKKGFTLVELLVSLFLFTFFLSIFFLGLGAGLRSFDKVVKKAGNKQVENLVREKMVQEIRSAEEILTNSSTFEIKLKVGSEIISYGWKEGKIWRKKNNYLAYLTDVGETSSLTFAYLGKNMVAINLGGISTLVSLRNSR